MIWTVIFFLCNIFDFGIRMIMTLQNKFRSVLPLQFLLGLFWEFTCESGYGFLFLGFSRYWFSFNINNQSVCIFYFFPDLVLRNCIFQGIYQFLLDCPFYLCVISTVISFNSLYFYGLSSFVSDFIDSNPPFFLDESF